MQTVVADYTDHRRAVKLTGEVAARVTINASFRVSGRVTDWIVDVGDRVKAGQILARIDPKEQIADVTAADAAVMAARANVVQASLDLERQRNLHAKNVATQEVFDQAETTLQTAKASLNAAQAQLETSRDALSHTELLADADGIVTARNIEAGQVVQVAQTIYSLAQDGPRDAIFKVYETLLFEAPTDAIEIGLVGDPSVQTHGMIREIAPTIDDSTGTVQVKVSMDRTPEPMTLGASVTGIARARTTKVMAFPWSALSQSNGKPAVWIVGKSDSKVDLRPITVGSYDTGVLLVSNGIAEGEVVVTDGTKSLRPGQIVEVMKEPVE